MSPFWFHLDPEHALEGPRMAIRVPGEFHEASSRGQLCHRASRSPSYARPRHFPTRDEFISTAGHEPRDPTSLPAAPRPTTANRQPTSQPPANQPAAPRPTTAGQDPATRANHQPKPANQPAAPSQPTAGTGPKTNRQPPCRVIRLCGIRLAGLGRC